MGKVQIKAFIVSKEGAMELCQDSMAMNLANGRFVVADGLSNSYHPELVSQLLCKLFVCNDTLLWESEDSLTHENSKELTTQWNKEVADYESTLSGRRLQHAIMKRDKLKHGASTLAGIELDSYNKTINYQILGDSTLFKIDKEGNVSAITSHDEVSNILNLHYDNHPHYIRSDGKQWGKCAIGQLRMHNGFVILMTDGCAEWFATAYEENSDVVNKLWAFDGNNSFEELVVECRKAGKMEDDLAAILLKIDESWDGTYEVEYFPRNMSCALLMEVDNNAFDIMDGKTLENEVEVATKNKLEVSAKNDGVILMGNEKDDTAETIEAKKEENNVPTFSYALVTIKKQKLAIDFENLIKFFK